MYQYTYKTSNPNLRIACVTAFPNIQDTLEKVIEYYEVKKLQRDPLLLDIYSDYYSQHGNRFIPLYFEDDCPKLAKLEAVNPRGKGSFWCIGYFCPHVTQTSQHTSKYDMPSHEWYRNRLDHWMDNYHEKYSSITKFLFKCAVKKWIYDETENFSDEMKSRRFQLIENSSFRPSLSIIENDHFQTKKGMFDFLDEMYKTNIYEFIYKQFKYSH